MGSRAFLLVAIFALTTLSVTMAHASSQTQISLTSTGNTEIDLAWNEEDRLINVWTEFSDFNTNDGSFIVKVIHSETGKVVSDSVVQVITQRQSSTIDFISLVMYGVNAEDVCQNEEFNAKTSSEIECSPLTGQYEMQITTNDGAVVESTSFNVIDSRV